MATLPEYENVDNARSTMPEYKSKLTQMYQYQNKSVAKFLSDIGRMISKREFANDTAAIAAGLKSGDLYSTPTGEVKVIK
jgi:hypothetical protein